LLKILHYNERRNWTQCKSNSQNMKTFKSFSQKRGTDICVLCNRDALASERGGGTPSLELKSFFLRRGVPIDVYYAIEML
jgi:hypothetical protein